MAGKVALCICFVVLILNLSLLGQELTKLPPRWQHYVESKEALSVQQVSARVGAQDAYYLLQLREPLKQSRLREAGYHLYRQLDALHWIVKPGPAKAGARLQEPPAVLYRSNHLWKCAGALLATEKLHSDQQAQFVLKGDQAERLKEALKHIKGLSIGVEHALSGTVLVRCTYQVLQQQVLPLKELTFADLAVEGAREESRLLDVNHSLNGLNIIRNRYPDLQGQGQLVSIKENKYNPADLDLLGRHVPNALEAGNISAHATQMATLLAGAGNTSPASRGVLPAARLSSSSFESLLPDDEAYFRMSNIFLQNHSYGTTPQGYYGAEAAAYDAATLANPKLLHVFSAGNSGTSASEEGPYRQLQGFANLSGNFKQAKNILLVGALDTLKNLDPYVSRGPAYDGRVKPELVAYSTLGSSNAAALVSGAAGLLQQACQQQQGSLPSAALLKAVMINTAEDVGLPGLDYLSGYGSLQAHTAMENLLNKQYFEDSMQAGEIKEYQLKLPKDVHELRISLVWHDEPAQPGSAHALVNDLDLELVPPSGAAPYLPWVLNSFPAKDSLLLPAKRAVDRYNNIEQVSIRQLAEGIYIIRVRAHDVSAGKQPFAIAYHWSVKNTFEWLYPTGADQPDGREGQTLFFRWEAHFQPGQTAVLTLSDDGGKSWQQLDEAVLLEEKLYRWKTPALSGKLIARMSVQGQHYLSDSFVASAPPVVGVGFNCPDSLLISWRKMPAASAYVLYRLGKTTLEPQLSTADTFAVLYPLAGQQPYFALAPLFEEGTEGKRSKTFDYTLQGTGCYITNFQASLVEEKVTLLLQLGTVHQLSAVLFERQTPDGFASITSFSEASLRSFKGPPDFEVEDLSPEAGFNRYRVRLLFKNGTEMVSEPQQIFYLGEEAVQLFPNPLQRGAFLNVFLRQMPASQVYLTVYNLLGQPLFHYEIMREREEVLIPPLAAGMYLYTVKGKGLEKSGKLLLR